MTLFLLPIAAGVVLGLARGGRLGGLADLGLRAPGLVFAALAAQAALGTGPARALSEGVRASAVVASYAAVGAWLALNAACGPRTLRPALALLAVGWLLNALAIVPNGGMPVSAQGLRRAGVPADFAVEEGQLFKHVRADGDTVAPWLGDVLPVRPLRSVVSVGDVVLAAGIAVAVSAAMARSAAARSTAPPPLALPGLRRGQ